MSKFDTPEAEALYLESTPDEEVGSVEDFGWYGLYRAEHVILYEDSQGFVTTFTAFDEGDWAALEVECAEFYGEYHD